MTIRSGVVAEDSIRSQIGLGDCVREKVEIMNDAFNRVVCEEENYIYF